MSSIFIKLTLITNTDIMEYRRLPNTDFDVPVLTLGTGTFGGSHGFEGWGHTDVEGATRMIDIAVDAGLNMFDTADLYSHGRSEEILGKATHHLQRDKVLIASKVGFPMSENPNDRGASRVHIIRACEDSLRRLDTDYIDLYYVHIFDNTVPVEETMRALDDLVRSGKVRHIGCSNYSGWHLMKSEAVSEANGLSRFCAHQVYYSLLHREFEWELMTLGIDQGVGTFVWSPLAAGRLAGRYRRGQEIPKDGRVATNGVPVEDSLVDYEKLYNIVDVLDEIAEETGHTVAQVALNWLLCRPTITSLVIGARTEEHLKSNLGAIGWQLTPEQIARLDEVSRQTKTYPYWHQDINPEMQSQLFR